MPRRRVFDPGRTAESFWDTIRLPVPHPSSRPGYAITGTETYLSTGDTTGPRTWTRSTPLGPLTVTGTGTYTVDWGDGTLSTGPYTTTGGPYPSGTITHVYEDVGTVTITVTESWTATWKVGAAHGTLTRLVTTGRIPGFVVRQVQAVITG